MLISICICTHNRADLLVDAVNGALAQELPSGLEVEVLVVDNNSSDGTRERVLELARRDHRVRHVWEERQGLCLARNRGLAEAKGELIAYVDDDAIPTAHYAAELAKAHRTYHADGYGGRIRRHTDDPIPRWIVREGPWANSKGILEEHDMGDSDMPYGRDNHARSPVGANFVLNVKSVESHGGFLDALHGRGPNDVIGGDDSELFRRWVGQGATFYYLADAAVLHRVLPERLTRRYALRWQYWRGISGIRTSVTDGANGIRFLPDMARRTKRALSHAATALYHQLLLHGPQAFYHWGRMVRQIGAMREVVRQSKSL